MRLPAEEALAKVRAALVGIVGCDTRVELETMEGVIRLAPIPEEDRVNTLNAIHALIATLPEVQGV